MYLTKYMKIALNPRVSALPRTQAPDFTEDVRVLLLNIQKIGLERFRVFSGQDRSSLQLRADAPDSEWTDVPGTLSDSSRPLVFYEVRFPSPPLTVTKQLATDSVQLSW